MTGRLALIAIALSMSVGCTMNPWTSPHWVYEATKVETDQFKGVTTVSTPWRTQYLRGSNVLKVDSKIRLHRVKGQRDSTDIYVRATVYEWMFLDSAGDNVGNQAKTSTVDREVKDCSAAGGRARCQMEEHLIIHVPYSYLDMHAKRGTGAQWKVWGKRGEIIVDIPPAMIRGFVARLQQRPPNPEARLAHN